MQPHPLRICAEILNQSRIPLLLGSENLTSMGGVFDYEDYTLTIVNKDKELCLPINLESSGHLHLRFYSPNFMLAVHLHQDWDHGHHGIHIGKVLRGSLRREVGLYSALYDKTHQSIWSNRSNAYDRRQSGSR